jgi:3-oxoacyl-[acyl-carrier-protein] synthase-3
MTPKARIIGTGSYVPERVLTNFDLEHLVDTSDQWIVERTGIRERRVAAPGEASSDMAAKAAQRALDMAGLKATDIDLIIVGTISADMPLPSAACFVQAKIGATNAAAFDISAACAGSLYAMSIAEKFISCGQFKCCLVVGVELLTRVMDWTDRNTCVLFGDAAGAIILAPAIDDGRGLLSTHLHTDGRQAEILYIPGGGSRFPTSDETVRDKMHFVKMNGREVYKSAVRNLSDALAEAFTANHCAPGDIQHIVTHQANLRILEAVMKRFEIPMERVWLNLQKYGNTSSASLPMSLDEANRAGRFKSGDLIAMMAIGAGMAWGSAMLRW